MIKLWMLIDQCPEVRHREPRLSAARRQDSIEMMEARGLEVREKMTVIDIEEILKEHDATLRPPSRPAIPGLSRMRKPELAAMATHLGVDASGAVDQLRLRLKRLPADTTISMTNSSSGAALIGNQTCDDLVRPTCPEPRRGTLWDE